MTHVVAEGSGSRDEVIRVLEQAPRGWVAVTVALTTRLEVAFSRAQADPTRGVSKEHDFSTTVYSRWPQECELIAPDLMLDTSDLGVTECVQRIRSLVAAIREDRTGERDQERGTEGPSPLDRLPGDGCA